MAVAWRRSALAGLRAALPAHPSSARLVTSRARPSRAPAAALHSGTGRGRGGGEAVSAARGFGAEATEVYRCVKRVRAAGISGIALLQGGFWVGGAYVTATAAGEPLVSPLWMAGGAGLSALFAGMVGAYLSRSVAVLSVAGAGATKVHVQTYRFGGLLGAPVALETRHIVGGPKGADERERHWTFGVKEIKDAGATYYVVDRKRGVLDEDALSKICSTAYGGEALMVLAHKRQAVEMKTRWRQWEESKQAPADKK